MKAASKVVRLKPGREFAPAKFDPDLPERAKALHGMLCRVCAETGRSWMKEPAMVEALSRFAQQSLFRVSASLRSVQRAVRDLEAAGYIVVKDRGPRGLLIELQERRLHTAERRVRPARARRKVQPDLPFAEGVDNALPPALDLRQCGGDRPESPPPWRNCGKLPAQKPAPLQANPPVAEIVDLYRTGEKKIYTTGERDHGRRGPPVHKSNPRDGPPKAEPKGGG